MDLLGLSGNGKLNYLEFVKTLVKAAMLILLWLYRFAKAKFYSLVIQPLYNKAKSIFLQFLSFLDKKVEEKAPANVKKVLNRINQIVSMLSNLWSMIQIQIKLVGPENAMKVAVTFVKDFIISKLLPMLASKLFQFPGLSSAAQMAFPALSGVSEKINDSLSKISSTIPGIPKLPVPDLRSAFKQVEDAAATAPTQIDSGHITDGLTKAFDQVGIKPAEDFIGNITKPFSIISGTPKADETDKSGNIAIDDDIAKQAPAEKDNNNRPNILEELTQNTLKTVGSVTSVLKNDDNITQAK